MAKCTLGPEAYGGTIPEPTIGVKAGVITQPSQNQMVQKWAYHIDRLYKTNVQKLHVYIVVLNIVVLNSGW